ncbi:hypothetical protein DFQ28_006189 [Apophysomyces sp. BC1034]|nr:hypothetical protein DFQ28_006189 [Apophysomyces sp. BC1034]
MMLRQGNVIIRGSAIDAKNVHLEVAHRVDLLNSTDTERLRNNNDSKSGRGIAFRRKLPFKKAQNFVRIS